jgi:hypothetical protein
MCIEHCDCLSWFSGLRESHEQDGERLSLAKALRIETASGDPAMAIGPSSDADGHRPVALIGSLLLPDKRRRHLAIRHGTRELSRAQTFQRRIPSRSINSL